MATGHEEERGCDQARNRGAGEPDRDRLRRCCKRGFVILSGANAAGLTYNFMAMAFELRRERHAIGEFTATIQLFQPVGAATFAEVVSRLKEVASEQALPAAVPIQVLQFPAPASAPGMASLFPPTGVGFQRFSPDGEVAASLVCDGDEIVWTLREYTEWEAVLPVLSSIFTTLFKVYAQEVPAIKSIKLQYLNEFLGKQSDYSLASEILRPSTAWVAPFVFNSQDFWHSHIGEYRRVSAIQRNLVNVNCDVAHASDGSSLRSYVKVLILAGCFFNITDESPLVLSVDNAEQMITKYFEEAHNLEKSVLKEVIADQYLVAMGANDA